MTSRYSGNRKLVFVTKQAAVTKQLGVMIIVSSSISWILKCLCGMFFWIFHKDIICLGMAFPFDTPKREHVNTLDPLL